MIVCADDFGLSGDVNAAILDLAAARRVVAVSCMVHAPAFDACSASALADRGRVVSLGLHLTFTADPEFRALAGASAPPDEDAAFRRLLALGLRRRLDAGAARLIVEGQYSAFIAAFRREPEFLDGHMHVHQFPGVRDAVVSFAAGLPAGARPYVRNTATPLTRILAQGVAPMKTFWISRWGAPLHRRLRAVGVPTNDGFAGLYDARRHARFPDYLRRFVRGLDTPGAILMVHPGLAPTWRRVEYDTLSAGGWEAGR